MSKKGHRHAGDGLIFEAPQKHVIRNERTYREYKAFFKDLMLSLYKWDGFSETVNTKKLEEWLYQFGVCYFFNEPSIGDLVLPGKIYGTLTDVYGEHLSRQMQGQGTRGDYTPIRTNSYDRKEWVKIENSPTSRSMSNVVNSLCFRLATIKRAIDINIEGQRTPILLVTDEDTRFTDLNIMKQYEEGKHIIVVSTKTAAKFEAKSFDIRVDFVADKLWMMLHNEVNEFLSQVGVENSSTDKRERVNVQESNGDAGLQERGRSIFLNAREDAAEEINSGFEGRQARVRFNSDLITMLNAPQIVSGLANKQIDYKIDRTNDSEEIQVRGGE